MMSDLPNAKTDAQDPDLCKKRETSTIPKTGSGATWVYPSPQQFFHAMRRKNKDPQAELMDATVHVHNVVNEESWQKILEWEKLHERRCPNVTLTRFVGKYDDLSVKGRLSSWFSQRGRPFDRHDWFVDRCGEQVRYIIDYYDDQQLEDDIQVHIDARPAAFDSFRNFADTFRMPFYRRMQNWSWIGGFGFGSAAKEKQTETADAESRVGAPSASAS